MDNVVPLTPRSTKPTRLPAAIKAAQSRMVVRRLLADTIQSLEECQGEPGLCHLAAVEKIRSLLHHACEVDNDNQVTKWLAALSLVELARLALEAGSEAFDGGTQIEYHYAIAEALQAAEAHLEVANG